ncbi:uncharacterized protein [Temnothorax nylanderi]|uniref:uncharacterized protein n=1 Tax=Temnothorax nylanderi TaxID=102681 RepID=UPI003A8631C9
MRPYSRENAGHNYILTVIDVLSKYAWAIPLKTKSGKDRDGSPKIFREDARYPKNLQTDKERNSTTRTRWIDSLPRLLSNYNRRRHRTIGMRPTDVTPTVAEKLLRTVYSRAKIAAPARFRVDDPVRVSKLKQSSKGLHSQLDHRDLSHS